MGTAASSHWVEHLSCWSAHNFVDCWSFTRVLSTQDFSWIQFFFVQSLSEGISIILKRSGNKSSSKVMNNEEGSKAVNINGKWVTEILFLKFRHISDGKLVSLKNFQPSANQEGEIAWFLGFIINSQISWNILFWSCVIQSILLELLWLFLKPLLAHLKTQAHQILLCWLWIHKEIWHVSAFWVKTLPAQGWGWIYCLLH